MSCNRAFWKAFHSFTHPLSLISIVVLLFNDHWLRYAHPSWLTGKLGDFTWLVFAPFIAALLFAWLIPQRLKHHTYIVGWLSIGFIGVWFATAKTIPFVHEMITETLYWLVGWRGQLRLDVTDLLTLPALIISWYVWQQASDSKVSLKPLAYVAFGLGLLGTLASDSSYSVDHGITHICSQNDFLYVKGGNGSGYGAAYYSYNGGLFWTTEEPSVERRECKPEQTKNNLIVDGLFQFRWIPDELIEVSYDDGNTWSIENHLLEYDQDIRNVYLEYRSTRTGLDTHIAMQSQTPINAHYDEQSGNVVFAMGHYGVLVREANGDYTWVTVGDKYGLDDLSQLHYIDNALFFELWLALATIFLIVTTSTRYIRRQQRKKLPKLIIISWIGYVLILFFMLLSRNDDITLTNSDFVGLVALSSFGMLIFFGIPLSIGAVWDILRNFRQVVFHIFFAGIGTGALFIFPFLLWTQGRIPRYIFAYVIALLLTVLGLYASSIYLERILPTLAPEKAKHEDVKKGQAKAEVSG
jgi:hypothetical protein